MENIVFKDFIISREEEERILSCLYCLGYGLPQNDYKITNLWNGHYKVEYSKENIFIGNIEGIKENYPMFNNDFWIQQCKNIIGFREFKKNTIKLLRKNNILSAYDIFKITDKDLQFAIANRIGSKKLENSVIPLMYINYLPEKYKAENSLTKNLYTYIKGGNIIPFYEFSKNCNAEEYYFTASHRTFFRKDTPYFFKLDVPYKISSKVRLLKRNEARVRASGIVKSELEKYPVNNIKAFDDYNYTRIDNRSIMYRRKFLNGITIPLFAVFQSEYFQDNQSIFDYLFENHNKDGLNKVEYLLSKFLLPIIGGFEFFTKLSIKYNKLIFPYDFHMQNISFNLDQNDEVSFIYQDFDMSKDLTEKSFYEQFDLFFEKFVLLNILQSVYGISFEEKKTIIERVKLIIESKILNQIRAYFKSNSPQKTIIPDLLGQYILDEYKNTKFDVKYQLILRDK